LQKRRNRARLCLKSFIAMTHYKPYSPEWHRQRYLKEALLKYLDDGVDNNAIYTDILDILQERSESAYAEYERVTELESMLQSK